MGPHRFIPPLALLLPAAVALLQLLASARCAAQERRLSVEPPITVPLDLRIQSAATSGTTTFAAWGSIGVRDGGTFDSFLVGQAILEGSPAGEPVRLTEISAAPCSFVKVLAFDSSFVVVWNDRRSDAPGVWTRPIGLNGQPLGVAARVAADPPPFDINVSVVKDGRIATLIWQMGDTTLRLLTIGAGGSAVRSDTIRGSNLDQVRPVGSVAALRIGIAGGGRVMLPDGSTATAPGLSGANALAFHVASDGSMAVLSDSVVRFYEDWQDSVPVRSLRVDSLVPAFATARYALRRPFGDWIVDRMLEEPTFYLQSAGRRAVLTRATISDTLAVLDSTGFNRLDSMQVSVSWSGSYDWGSATTEVFAIVTRPDGGYASRIRVNLRSWGKSGMHVDEDRWIGYDVDSAGNWRQSTLPISPASVSGARTEAIEVRRVADSMRSTIAVGADSVALRSDIRIDGSYVNQSMPVVYRMSGQLRVGWLDSVATDEGPGFSLARVDLTSMSTDPSNYRSYNLTPGHVRRWTIRTAAGLVACSERKNDQVYPPQYRFSLVHDVVRTSADLTMYGANAFAYYEPDDDELSVLVQTSGSSLDMRASRGDTTTRQVRVSRGGYIDAYLPLRGMQALFFRDGKATLVDSCVDVGPVELPAGFLTGTITRLRGDQFLAWRYVDSCNCIRFDRFQFTVAPARIVRLATGWLPTSSTDLCPIEVPEDSSIVVLRSGPGVRMYRLSRTLKLIGEPTLITAGTHMTRRPWGIVEDTTLFVVWEDHRSAKSDIYGTAVALEGIAAPPPPEPPPPGPPQPDPPAPSTQTSSAIPVVTPLPAHDVLQVTVGMNGSAEAYCELLDGSGRLVALQSTAALPTEPVTFFLTVRFLPDGMYIVRTRRGSTVNFSRALVIHPD